MPTENEYQPDKGLHVPTKPPTSNRVCVAWICFFLNLILPAYLTFPFICIHFAIHVLQNRRHILNIKPIVLFNNVFVNVAYK